MKALPEKLAEQYADDKSKAYYIGENGEKKWYITPRGQYSKEDFLAGYEAATDKYLEQIRHLEMELQQAKLLAMKLEAER